MPSFQEPASAAPRIVQKFGGAALRDGPAIEHVVALVRAYGGPRPIVVVSALAGVTAMLEGVARAAGAPAAELAQRLAAIRIRHRSVLAQLGLDPELCDRLLRELAAAASALAARRAVAPRELDFVLSFGERLAARIVARALDRGGLPAAPIDAYDLGLVTDSNHGDARPLEGTTAELGRALRGVPGIPVVTGFLARDVRGHLTTLGRNGSDYTAALVAEAVAAAELQLWKDVSGVMTADPALVPGARLVPELGWDDAEALARAGAAVLHPEAVGPMRRAGIAVCLRDLRAPDASGSRIAGPSRGADVLAVVTRPLDESRTLLTVVGRGLAQSWLDARLASAGLVSERAEAFAGQAVTIALADSARAACCAHAAAFDASER